MQLTLDLPGLNHPPPARSRQAQRRARRPVVRLGAYDIVVVCSSAGKDSMALLAYIARLVREQNYKGRVVVLHNDLGTTGTGEPVEWPGVEALAREHADRFGFEFVVRRRPGGGLWDELLGQRRRWPSSNARWCTSDQKESQAMTWVTQAVAEFWETLGAPADRPVEVLYCLGLRGQESAGRAAQPVLQINERRSSGNRRITRWLPIHGFTVREVWEEIRAAGLRPHAAYSWGMRRLSCSLCVLASMEDLMLAAALRPALAADYRRAEIELGHRFTERLSMGEILAGLDAARNPSVDTVTVLHDLVCGHLAGTPQARGEGRTRSGRPRRPWTEQELADRSAARAREILTAARRAVALAGRADTGMPVSARWTRWRSRPCPLRRPHSSRGG